MKILEAKQEFGQILVEYEILSKKHKMLFPLDTGKEEINATLEKLEQTQIKREATIEKNKEQCALEAKAEETIKSLKP